MMISRWPNNRASREYLPGPRNTTAAVIMAVRTRDNFASNRLGVGACHKENPMPSAPTPATTPAIGVSRPSSNAAPDASPISDSIHVPVE